MIGDYTACMDSPCKNKETCYRWRVGRERKTSGSWAVFYEEGKQCDYYMKSAQKKESHER